MIITELILVASTLLFTGLVGGCLFIIKKQSVEIKAQSQHQREELDSIRTQIEMVSSGSVGMGQRLNKLGREISWLKEQTQHLSMSRNAQVSYDSAIRLAENGAGVEGLIQNCKMTAAEAELILKMHAGQNSSEDSHPPKQSLYSLAKKFDEKQQSQPRYRPVELS